MGLTERANVLHSLVGRNDPVRLLPRAQEVPGLPQFGCVVAKSSFQFSYHNSPLFDEPCVSETFPCCPVNEAIQPVQRVYGHVAVIEAECEFIDVTKQVLRTRVMIYAVQSALQDRPDALDAVRVDSPAHELTGRVINAVMAIEQAAQVIVRAIFIGAERRPRTHRAVNLILDRVDVGRNYDHSPASAIALPHSEDGGFPDATASRVELFILVLVGFFAAHESFVDLDDSAQRLDIADT